MSEFILMKNVRCSFPHLSKKPVINGQEGKYGAVLMLDPKQHAEAITEIESAMTALANDKWKGKMPPSDRLCLRRGEDRGRPEYEGFLVLSANNVDRPVVIDGAKVRIENPQDCPVYGGCYVNAKVRLWAQDNQYGKRINCELVTIQFARDGEPLDGRHVSEKDAIDGFDAVDAVEDDDDFLAA